MDAERAESNLLCTYSRVFIHCEALMMSVVCALVGPVEADRQARCRWQRRVDIYGLVDSRSRSLSTPPPLLHHPSARQYSTNTSDYNAYYISIAP